MQRSSQTVQDYMNLCTQYEMCQFHKIQELEYFYLITKKYYLGKAFTHELATKLENNKFNRVSNCSNGSSSNGNNDIS